MLTSALPSSEPVTRVVHIAADWGVLAAELTVPPDASGVILFAKTNGSQRLADSDPQLAADLQKAGFATLMLDLLTPREELIEDAARGLRFEPALLSRRLIEAIDWLADEPELGGLDVGIFGEGSGAAAAFVAACVRPTRVAGIVSYTKRLDPATPVLERVRAPSLIIVSGDDATDLRSNDAAFRRLKCSKELICIASGGVRTAADLDAEISRLALDWFTRTMTPVFTAASANNWE